MGEQLKGTVSEEHKAQVEDLVEEGQYESFSDFVEFATRYALSEKHNS